MINKVLFQVQKKQSGFLSIFKRYLAFNFHLRYLNEII